eukprot:SM000148S01031  [mRNA]  locus=s148:375651:376357:+ [translate_table: standard]
MAADAEESQLRQAVSKGGGGHQADVWQSLDMATLASLWSSEQLTHVPDDQSPTFLSPMLMNHRGLAEVGMHVDQHQHTSASMEESSEPARDCGSVPDEIQLHEWDNRPFEDHAKLAKTVISSPRSTAPKSTRQIRSDSSPPMSSIQPRPGEDTRRTRQEHQEQTGNSANIKTSTGHIKKLQT